MQVRGQKKRRGYKPPPLKKQIGPLADGSMPKEVSTTEMWFRWAAIHMVRCSRVTRFLLVASLVPFGVISAQTPPRAEIEQVIHSFIDAHNRGAGAVAAMYAQQAGVSSVGDGEIVRGWDRIRERLGIIDELHAAGGSFQVRLSSTDIMPLGPDHVLVLSNYLLTGSLRGTESEQRGAITLVLQRFAGEWKIVHDHTSAKTQEAP